MPANNSPTLTGAVSDQFATEFSPFNYIIPLNTFADIDANDTITYSILRSDGGPLPSWLTFDPISRSLNGIPQHTDIGNIALKLIATDSQNASSTTYFSLNVSADTIAPTAPIITLFNDSGASQSDQITNDGSISITGIEDLATVSYSTDAGLTWQSSFSAIEGLNSLQVRQQDQAGNYSATSQLNFTLDRVVASPIVNLLNDTGVLAVDRITSDARLSFSGVESGSVISYLLDDGQGWLPTFTPHQGTNSLQIKQTDAAGNTSSASAFNFTYDNVAPAFLSFDPRNGGIGLSPATTFLFGLSESVSLTPGKIALFDYTNNRVQNIPLGLGIAGNDLTVNPAQDLNEGTHYQIRFFDGFLADIAGNTSTNSPVYDFYTRTGAPIDVAGFNWSIGSLSDSQGNVNFHINIIPTVGVDTSLGGRADLRVYDSEEYWKCTDILFPLRFNAATGNLEGDARISASYKSGSYVLNNLNLFDRSGKPINLTLETLKLSNIDPVTNIVNQNGDNIDPIVSGYRFSDFIYDRSTEAWKTSCYFHAEDASGLNFANYNFNITSAGLLHGRVGFNGVITNLGSNNYRADFVVDKYATSGRYSLDLRVHDNSLNYYGTNNLSPENIPAITLNNPYEDILPPQLNAWNIAGIIDKTDPNNERPMIKITGQWGDNLSGLSQDGFWIRSFYPLTGSDPQQTADNWVRMDQFGRFGDTFNLANPSREGVYSFEVWMTDKAGNLADVSQSGWGGINFDSLGFVGDIQVYATDPNTYDPNRGDTIRSASLGAIMFGGVGSDNIYGDVGNNYIYGGRGSDTVAGGSGNDLIDGGAGDDIIDGGAGDNTASFESSSSNIYANLTYGVANGDGNDKLANIRNIFGGVGNDQIIGDSFGNILQGGDGNDTVDGGAGDDLIIGGNGAGDDTYVGGDGVDTVKYTSATAAITIDLKVGTAQATAGGDAASIGQDILSSIENIIAGYYDDTLIGDNSSNSIYGEAGNDRIRGGAGSDFLSGETGDDLIFGGDAIDPTTAGGSVYRLYQATLNRAPDVSGFNNWQASINSGRTLQSITSGFINSAEFQQRYGSLNANQFVTLLYNNVLSRAPDAGGLANWVGSLNSGASRESIVNGFSESQEFQNNTVAATTAFTTTQVYGNTYGQVYRLYGATLGRAPDAGGFVSWVNSLAGGQSLQNITTGFIRSAEFQQTYGSLNNTQFVTLLYNNVLNRAPDTGGLNSWVSSLNSGASRESVVNGFSESQEYQNNTSAALVSFISSSLTNIANTLVGGEGTNSLIGGLGSDIFKFDLTHAGSDNVYGLQQWDVLNFSNFGYSSASDSTNHMSQSGGNVVFVDRGQTITFHDTTLAAVADAQFTFG